MADSYSPSQRRQLSYLCKQSSEMENYVTGMASLCEGNRQAGLFSHESTAASRELLRCYERLKLNLTLCLGHLLLSVMSVFLWHSWILSLIMCLISSINLLYVLSTWCFSLLTWFPCLCPHLWFMEPLVDTLIFSYHTHSLKLSHMWYSSLLLRFCGATCSFESLSSSK